MLSTIATSESRRGSTSIAPRSKEAVVRHLTSQKPIELRKSQPDGRLTRVVRPWFAFHYRPSAKPQTCETITLHGKVNAVK